MCPAGCRPRRRLPGPAAGAPTCAPTRLRRAGPPRRPRTVSSRGDSLPEYAGQANLLAEILYLAEPRAGDTDGSSTSPATPCPRDVEALEVAAGIWIARSTARLRDADGPNSASFGGSSGRSESEKPSPTPWERPARSIPVLRLAPLALASAFRKRAPLRVSLHP